LIGIGPFSNETFDGRSCEGEVDVLIEGEANVKASQSELGSRYLMSFETDKYRYTTEFIEKIGGLRRC
jgi:hypothetical protein